MEELIRFRTRIDLLSKQEFIAFISSQDHEYLINTFFNSYLYQFITMKNAPEFDRKLVNIQQMTANIDKIIHQRDKNQQTYPQNDDEDDDDMDLSKHPQSTKLDQLALSLISHVSGYLQLTDLLSFELVSRNIFIGSRSPIIPQIMLYDQFVKCLEFSNNTRRIYNWYRFKNIKSISLPLEHTFNQYYNVKRPRLNNKIRRDPKPEKGRDVETFRKLPIFHNLTHLGLHYDDAVNGNYFCKWLFGGLLTKDSFPNLQYLSTEDPEII